MTFDVQSMPACRQQALLTCRAPGWPEHFEREHHAEGFKLLLHKPKRDEQLAKHDGGPRLDELRFLGVLGFELRGTWADSVILCSFRRCLPSKYMMGQEYNTWTLGEWGSFDSSPHKTSL